MNCKDEGKIWNVKDNIGTSKKYEIETEVCESMGIPIEEDFAERIMGIIILHKELQYYKEKNKHLNESSAASMQANQLLRNNLQEWNVNYDQLSKIA